MLISSLFHSNTKFGKNTNTKINCPILQWVTSRKGTCQDIALGLRYNAIDIKSCFSNQ